MKILPSESSAPSIRRDAFIRGWHGHCPKCNAEDIFETRYRFHPSCPQCGLPLEQEDGWALGAIPLNYTMTCIGWILPAALLVIFGLISVKTGMIIAGLGVLIIPWLTYRYSKCVWLGTYYAVLPNEMRDRGKDERGDIH